ncbi:MAG: methylated-DNA--[protein]-cysteine S-methyltransferase [Gemmatimonadetes bacterium]|nr:methylated-DNA--[protein]-cysteine S-methyltransferase [Gemmatimonadota bacterium]
MVKTVEHRDYGRAAFGEVDGTPIGRFSLVATGRGLAYGRFGGGGRRMAEVLSASHADDPADADEHLVTALSELDRYFARELRSFGVALDLRGRTPFQERVLAQLRAIPYGMVASYGAIAEAIGQGDAARAVGAAVGSNPIPVVIPCHRVVRADGALGGYGGGVTRKATLLRIEGLDVTSRTAHGRVLPREL